MGIDGNVDVNKLKKKNGICIMNPRAGEVHQDWTPVVLYNPNATNKGKSETPQQNSTMTSKMRALDGDEIVAPPKVSQDLKKAMQQARLAAKKSQKQLALDMGVQAQLITDYENGKAVPNNAFLARLEKKLNVQLPRKKKS